MKMRQSEEKKRGVLIVNLGTPRSYQPKDVFRYLNEFLTDSRVIDRPWLRRQLLVRGLIVPLRYQQSAEQYRRLWTPQGSPLLWHGQRVQQKLQQALGPSYEVVLAMRYQVPSIREGLERLKQAQVDELMILPLFPQYASATTGSVYQKIMEDLRDWYIFPKLVFINHFFDHPRFIDAFCARARQYALASYDHYLFSFHGLPEKEMRKVAAMGYHNRFCYKTQCFATARAIATQLGLDEKKYAICFQSRLGKEPWIEPYASDVIRACAERGDKRVLVFSPSFVCDCLETTIEIAHEYHAEFKKWGGEELQLVEGLNDHPLWIEALQQIVLENTS